MLVTGTPTSGSTKLMGLNGPAVNAVSSQTWTGFYSWLINDSQAVAIVGSTSAGGYAVALNGVVQVESGSIIPTAAGGNVTLGTGTSPNPSVALNKAGDYATIFADYPVPPPGSYAKGKLIVDGVDVADTGSLYDSNGDSIPDTALSSINPGKSIAIGERQPNGNVDVYFFGSINGVYTTSILLRDTINLTSLPGNLFFTGSGGNGNWDLSTANFLSGAATVAFKNGDQATFGSATTGNGVNTGQFNISTPATVSPSTTIVTGSNAYSFSGSGGIGGTGPLIKLGSAALTLSDNNTYSGGTNVSAGSITFASAGAFPANSALTIAANASVVFANNGGSTPLVPVLSALNNNGTLDLTSNALIIKGANTSIGSITAQIATAYNGGAWKGTSTSGVITSSTAASDTTYLTALGIATGLTTFESQNVAPADLLIKYTYYGDADLTGSVDSADYTRIDNGFLDGLTGWQNGDFNYDNIINGSDYTLIDNAFNAQTAQLSNQIASPTSLVAAVPEPSTLMFSVTAGAMSLLRRNRGLFKNIRSFNRRPKPGRSRGDQNRRD